MAILHTFLSPCFERKKTVLEQPVNNSYQLGRLAAVVNGVSR